jgi:hypothetical protein
MSQRTTKNKIWAKCKKHPSQSTLQALFNRKLSLQETLAIFEHASACDRCYQTLLKIIKED